MKERMTNSNSLAILCGRRIAPNSVARKMLMTLMTASSAVFLLLLPSLAGASSAYSLQPVMAQMVPGQRRYRMRSYRQPQRQPPPGASYLSTYDYSDHFLDDDNWMTNPKIRLWDVRRKSGRPNQYSWTTKLIVANVVGFAAQVMSPRVTQWGVKLSDKILNGQELYRLISPVFLHGGLLHLLTNMYSLNNLGPLTERLFGSGRFLASYLVAGATGNLLSSMLSPNPALGASGAIFGIMAGFYVFLERNDWVLGSQGDAYSSAITQTLFLNLVLGYVNPMVDNWGHLGGAMGGAAMSYYFGPRLFLAELPGGGVGGRVLVDKPIIRLPLSIESIPEKVSNRVTRLVRRMQIWRFTANLPDKPWRRRQRDYRRRQDTVPNKSIKPKIDD